MACVATRSETAALTGTAEQETEGLAGFSAALRIV
jgi:hypothetical protein